MYIFPVLVHTYIHTYKYPTYRKSIHVHIPPPRERSDTISAHLLVASSLYQVLDRLPISGKPHSLNLRHSYSVTPYNYVCTIKLMLYYTAVYFFSSIFFFFFYCVALNLQSSTLYSSTNNEDFSPQDIPVSVLSYIVLLLKRCVVDHHRAIVQRS